MFCIAALKNVHADCNAYLHLHSSEYCFNLIEFTDKYSRKQSKGKLHLFDGATKKSHLNVRILFQNLQCYQIEA